MVNHQHNNSKGILGFSKKVSESERGSALMIAIFSSMFLIFLAMQVSEETISEYLTSTTGIKRVQALHAAKACERMSLLRIKAYQQASDALGGSNAGGLIDTKMLDMIWQMPFTWPPTVNSEMLNSDKDKIKRTTAKSQMKFNFISKISSEGGKIDINDLGSPSKGLREKTRKQLLDFFLGQVQNRDSAFAKEYADYEFLELLYNIEDWVDQDNQSLNGGSEKQFYTDFDSEYYPPNRPLKTYDELHMIEGMTDDIYQILLPRITIYGVKGINVNHAEKATLMALNQQLITELVADEIIKHREDRQNGGPFKNAEEFFQFLNSFGINKQDIEKEAVPLFFGTEVNFQIECMGIVGNGKTTTTRTIKSFVYDVDAIQNRLTENLKKDALAEGQTGKPDPCKDLKGEPLYECQCKGEKTTELKNQCIGKKREAAKGPVKKAKRRPGPPAVIYRQVY